jgi:hypothetical protein
VAFTSEVLSGLLSSVLASWQRSRDNGIRLKFTAYECKATKSVRLVSANPTFEGLAHRAGVSAWLAVR